MYSEKLVQEAMKVVEKDPQLFSNEAVDVVLKSIGLSPLDLKRDYYHGNIQEVIFRRKYPTYRKIG